MAQAAGATKAFGVSTLSAQGGVGGLGSASLVAGGAIAVGMGVAVKSALNFENAMTKVRINSNLTDAEINHLRGSILSLAGETGKAPKELADGLYFLASAGLSASQVQQTLEMSAKASAIGLGEVADIARLTATALNAYAKDGITAAEVTDTLAAAIRVGTAEPDEFANALGRIMPIAQKAGVEFDEVTGALAGLSNIGLDVNEGVTAMRGLLQALVAPTTQTKDALADLGITTDELRTIIAEDGIVAALRFLEEATDGNIDKLRDLIPNVRAITGAFGLTGQEAKKLDEAMQQVTDAEGDLSSAFQEWLKGPGAGVAQLFAKLQVLAIKLGDILLPLFQDVVGILGGVVDVLTAAVDLFTQLPQPIQQAALAMGTLALAAKGLGRVATMLHTVAAAETAATAATVAATAAQTRAFGRLAVVEGAAAAGATTAAAAAGGLLMKLRGFAALGASVLMINELRKAWDGLRHDQDAANRQVRRTISLFLDERQALAGGREGLEAYAKATEGVTDLTVRQDKRLLALIGAFNRLGVALDATTLKQVNNLLKTGDLSAAIGVLQRELNEGTSKFGGFGTASQRAANRAQELAIKVDAARGAIERLPKHRSVHFSESGLDEMIGKVQQFAQGIFGIPSSVSTNFTGSFSGSGKKPAGADMGAVRGLGHFTPISQISMAPSTPATTTASAGGRSGPVEIVGALKLVDGKAYIRGTLRQILREP